jgi:spore maturation protein CgeB
VIVPEWDYVPSKWRGTGMRALARLIRPVAVREFNAELVRQAERWRPELLLVFKGTFVQGRTISRLRDMGVRTYCFFPDVSFRAHGPWIPEALQEYDWVFTTKTFGLDDMREQLGITRASLLRHGFDPDVHRPLPVMADDARLFACDICFVGTWSEKKEGVIAALKAARPNLRIRVWGESWDRARAAELTDDVIGGHEVVGDQYARAIGASKINLAILSERRTGASEGDRITSRTFHIPAAGGFMLHERTDELLELFREGIDCACFEGAEELARVTDEYLADDRRRELVAERGHRLVWSRDSWDHRIREILARHESLAP